MDPSPDPDPPSEPDKPNKPERERSPGWFPRPPPIETAADFIVIVFAVTVASMLFLLCMAVVAAAFVGGDVKSYFTILAGIMTSIISALVGYLAGRNSGGPPGPQGPPGPLL